MDFFSRIEAARERHNVLEHPFYQRWSAGELTLDELAAYAGQYRHAVLALADASERAADAAAPALRAGLEAHAAEERSHVALWDEFTRAIGGAVEATPNAETTACASAWAGDEGRPLGATLAALYAIESGQPAIAETKRVGLLEHYGIEDGPATAYFSLHATLDHEHAAQERALLEGLLADEDEDALVAEAEAVLRANWKLLDGVDAARRSEDR
jgi:pyrroloquinoline-quinone synthase